VPWVYLFCYNQTRLIGGPRQRILAAAAVWLSAGEVPHGGGGGGPLREIGRQRPLLETGNEGSCGWARSTRFPSFYGPREDMRRSLHVGDQRILSPGGRSAFPINKYKI
jgi:hypothetical protein